MKRYYKIIFNKCSEAIYLSLNVLVFKRQGKWSGYLHSYCEWYISFMPPNQVLPKLLPMPRRSGIFYPIARAGIYCWGGGFWANIGIFLYSINLFIDLSWQLRMWRHSLLGDYHEKIRCRLSKYYHFRCTITVPGGG